MRLEARWLACALLFALVLGSCNTFDDPGDSDGFSVPDGPLLPPGGPRTIPGSFPVPPTVAPLPGAAGMFGPLPENAGSGWQPIDAGATDADGGGEDAGG